MTDDILPFRIVEITQSEYAHYKKVLASLQDALDNGPQFDCKACGARMSPPIIRGGMFPICDDCLSNLGKLSKRNRPWQLQ